MTDYKSIPSLSNFDILDIIKKAKSRGDKGFGTFSGVYMDDELANMKTLKANESLIVNLQTTKQNGSHWVAIVNTPKQDHIVYFDPYGLAPNKNAQRLIKSVKKDNLYTTSRLQMNDSRLCGYWCLMFIREMNLGKLTPYDFIYSFDQEPSPDNERAVMQYFGM